MQPLIAFINDKIPLNFLRNVTWVRSITGTPNGATRYISNIRTTPRYNLVRSKPQNSQWNNPVCYNLRTSQRNNPAWLQTSSALAEIIVTRVLCSKLEHQMSVKMC